MGAASNTPNNDEHAIPITISPETTSASSSTTRRGTHCSDIIIHKVCFSPKKTAFEELKDRLSEILFPDDPLYVFRNQTSSKKLLLGLQYIFPIIKWVPQYKLKLFRSDLVSGLTIASLAIPQGISYAKLADLPPIYGLYSSFVPPLIYAIFGSSRHIGIGPVSIASLVMATMLNEEVNQHEEPDLYTKLALTTTFFAGAFQLFLGLFRLGFIIDYLSRPTLIGFMAGTASLVSLQQLKGLLGIKNFTKKMAIVPVLSSVFHRTKEWSWQTIVMGFCFLIFLLTTRQIHQETKAILDFSRGAVNIRYHFNSYISAGAPLTSVIISTLIIYLLRSKLHGVVAIIGHLPEGINPTSTNKLDFHAPYLGVVVKTGIITSVLLLSEGIAVGRTFASMENYQIDANKEMTAIGLMNIIGSCTSCFLTTGSFSRSAINYNSGGKTVISNIVLAVTVLITLLFLMPLFHYTPNYTLSAIIITAVIGLIDYKAAYQLWRIDKPDFLACCCSFFGVLFISVQIGLAIAIGVSMLRVLLHITRPNTVVLGNIPGTQMYRGFKRYDSVTRIPSFLIIAIESPIYFANSNYLYERILRWVREEEGWLNQNDQTALKCVVFDMTAVTAIDSSGIDAIYELKRSLEKKSLELVLVNPVGEVMEKLHCSTFLESLVLTGLYLTIGEAVSDISATRKI